MKKFLETKFGPTELSIIDRALQDWLKSSDLERTSAEAEIGAAVMINLFREGYDTLPALNKAISAHRGLKDLSEPRYPASRPAFS